MSQMCQLQDLQLLPLVRRGELQSQIVQNCHVISGSDNRLND